MARAVSDVRTTLQALATNDNMIEDLLRIQESNIEQSGLDGHTWALVKLAAVPVKALKFTVPWKEPVT